MNLLLALGFKISTSENNVWRLKSKAPQALPNATCSTGLQGCYDLDLCAAMET